MTLAIVTAAIVVLALLIVAALVLPEPPAPRDRGRRTPTGTAPGAPA